MYTLKERIRVILTKKKVEKLINEKRYCIGLPQTDMWLSLTLPDIMELHDERLVNLEKKIKELEEKKDKD